MANTTEKTIEVFPFIGNNTEINKRNRAAQAYSEEVSKRNKKRKHRFTVDTAITLAMLIAIIIMVVAIIAKAVSMENGYYKRTETKQPNGNYYVYVTERMCTVTDIVEDYVTVYHNGNYYSFFGTGYVEGEQIICQFTNDWEIVGVSE